MINAIDSNIKFKGFYSSGNIKDYSEKQNRVIEDIKSKLGEKINDGDYMVSPGMIKDTVDLQHYAFGFKTVGAGVNKTYAYVKGSDKFIGSFDEEHPFDLKDLEIEPWKNPVSKSDNTWKFVAATIIALGAILIGNGALKKFYGNQNKANIENITPVVKDSLNTVKKDSINLFI